MKKYIYAIDVSLSNTGIAVFSNDAKLVFITSVDTKSEENHQTKLKLIADKMLELRKMFIPETVVFERGFYRFAASTEAVFKVHGLCQYLFWDVEQVFYAPMTIKKVVAGKGNVSKEEVRQAASKKYPFIKFNNNDESDAVAIGICYFFNNDFRYWH